MATIWDVHFTPLAQFTHFASLTLFAQWTTSADMGATFSPLVINSRDVIDNKFYNAIYIVDIRFQTTEKLKVKVM